MKKVSSASILALLVTSMMILVVRVQPVKARTINVPKDYLTIQAAINAATTGDTVFVSSGTYYENVVLNRSITLLGQNPQTTIIDGSGVGIVVDVTADNATVTGFLIRDSATSGSGIALEDVTNCSVTGNELANNGYWGVLTSANGRTPTVYSYGNNIIGNKIANSNIAIGFLGVLQWPPVVCSNDTVSCNNITHCGCGIDLVESDNNSVTENSIVADSGIALSGSQGNVISKNNIEGSDPCAISLYSAPIWGHLYRSSDNNTVCGNSITNSSEGICLRLASGNSIVGNNITANMDGVWLDGSRGNSISGNSIVTKDGFGIGFDYVNYAYLYNITSGGNIVTDNAVTGNAVGVWLNFSSDNRVFHNNFVHNSVQARVDPLCLNNTWDNGYPSGGNYWSSYTDMDLFSGPHQNVPGSDGVWDHPYTIDTNNVDHYPLLNPWVPPPSLNVKTWYWTSDTGIRSVASGDVDGDGKTEIVTGGGYFDGTRTFAQLCVWNGATLALKNVKAWYWTSHTLILSVAVGDVDGDGKTEIVTGGGYIDGARQVAQLCVWNGATLALKNVKAWYWTSHTSIASVAVGDVDADGKAEIVTGGWYYDTTRYVAQLCVWNGATLVLKNVQAWYWTRDTGINSVAVGDVDADGKSEIVTGGDYWDGSHEFAQLSVWNGATLALENVQAWYWTGDTWIDSVAVGDVDGDSKKEIVTGSCYYDGTREVAQLCVWNGGTLALKNVQAWYWTGDTRIVSVAVGDVDGDGKAEMVTGGYYYDGFCKAQLCVWDGAMLVLKNVQAWYWTGDTGIDSVAVGDVDADGKVEIVTGGSYYDGTRYVAQLCVWG